MNVMERGLATVRGKGLFFVRKWGGRSRRHVNVAEERGGTTPDFGTLLYSG